MCSSRIASIVVEHLPLQIESRLGSASLVGAVIISGIAWKPDIVLDASPETGVLPGMSVRQAQQLFPQARVLPAREELYYSQHHTIAQVCEQFSPELEDAGLGRFFLDVSGMQALHPTEQDLAATLLKAIVESTNLIARIGIAGNKFTAEQAARAGDSGMLILPQRERVFLASLPLAALPPDTDRELLRRLDLFGIENLGQFAALSPSAVVRQFGAGARSIHDLARGVDPRPLNVAAPPPAVSHIANFTRDPLRGLEPLMHRVEKLAKLTAESLEAAGYHAEALRVCLTLENDQEAQYAGTLKPPTADADRLALAAQRITSFIRTNAPVVSIRLTAYPLRPWHASNQQLSFLDAPSTREMQLRLVLESLWTRFGEMVVQVASLIGSPVPLRITVQVDSRGRPKVLQWAGWARFVATVEDHWRTASRWWQEPIEREHFLVRTQDGALYSVYSQDQSWYVDRKYPR